MTMPERFYFDTVAFRKISDAFEKTSLAADLRERIVISPLTAFEILSQLTINNADEILRQIHAVLNWSNQKTGLLSWPDDALFNIWFQKPMPDDGFTKRMEKAFNICLAAGSPNPLQTEAGRLKDVMDKMKQKTVRDFGRLLAAAQKETLEGEKFSEAWFRGIAERIKADPSTRKRSEIISTLNAYHEFEESKLSIALKSRGYNPGKHANDLLDAEQLIYLSDSTLCFITCDSGFQNLVKKSPQAKQIITVTQEELGDAAQVEALLRKVIATHLHN
jgi:hypothetical protein